MNDSATPAVAVEGSPEITSSLAAAGLTVIPDSVPVSPACLSPSR